MKSLMLAALMLFIDVGFGQNKTAGDTVTISGYYSIDVSYANMPGLLSKLIIGTAKLLGFAPNRLTYSETVMGSKNNCNDAFTMELVDQDGKEWLHIISDTACVSFAEPPRSKRDTLRADGVRFAGDLKNFFKHHGCPRLKETFRFGGDTLTFEVCDMTLGQINPVYRRYNPSRYVFYSIDQHGKLYMRCEFLVGFNDKFVIYPQIKAHLYAKDMDLNITLDSLSVK